MKIERKKYLKSCHSAGRCELCGKPCKEREPHHAVITRGAGGSDIEINIVKVGHTQTFQCECHSTVDSAEGRERCIKVIANLQGEKVTPQDIIDANYFIANQIHRLDSEWLIEEKIIAWDGSEMAKELVRNELCNAGVI